MANLKNAKRVQYTPKQKSPEQEVIGMIPRVISFINNRPWVPVVVILILLEVFIAGIYINLKTLFYYASKI